MRLALYQCPPGPDDLAGNLRRLREAAQRAAAQSADLLVCPEMYASGYNIGAERVAALAEAADGAIAETVAGIAREFDVGILYGYPESNPAGAPFNSVQLIDRQGERLRLLQVHVPIQGLLVKLTTEPVSEQRRYFDVGGTGQRGTPRTQGQQDRGDPRSRFDSHAHSLLL